MVAHLIEMQDKISVLHEQGRIHCISALKHLHKRRRCGPTDRQTDQQTDRPCFVAPEKYDRIVGKGGFWGEGGVKITDYQYHFKISRGGLFRRTLFGSIS